MKLQGVTGIADANYIVCDSCGYFWDIEASWPDPIRCPRCQHDAMWRFLTLPEARMHSHAIAVRNLA